MPQKAWRSEAGIVLALKALAEGRQANISEYGAIFVCDCEFNPRVPGIHLFQVAVVAAHVFVFKPHTRAQYVLPDTNVDGIPSLKSFLEDTAYCKVVQACANDAAKLREYGVTMRNVMDTAIADAVARDQPMQMGQPAASSL